MTLETVELTAVERHRLSEVDATKPTPVMYEHCARVWDAMCEIAEQTDEGIVYEGHTTKLFQRLNLPGPYYTPVMKHLTNMGCVEQLRRGGGSTLSKWRILARPSEESFTSVVGTNATPTGRMAQLEQMVRDLNRRVSNVEAVLASGDEA